MEGEEEAVEGRLEVLVRCQGVEKKIVGDVDYVIREVIKFVSSIYPKIELISRISLDLDVERFLSSCEGVFTATPEGVVIISDTSKLSDRDLILLHLAKSRFGFYLGRMDRDTLFINDILSATKKTAGTVAGRLSEMCAEGLAERVGKGEYRATTYGVQRFLDEVVAQVKKR